MIKIYTILKDGQPLMPKVMHGILRQNIECCLIPITRPTKKKYSEKNRNNNILQCIKDNKEDFIIIMDSDVVLENYRIIKEMINQKQDFVVATTRGEYDDKKDNFQHGIFLAKGEGLKKLQIFLKTFKIEDKYDDEHHCSLCRFFKSQEVQILSNKQNYECNRNI